MWMLARGFESEQAKAGGADGALQSRKFDQLRCLAEAKRVTKLWVDLAKALPVGGLREHEAHSAVHAARK